MNFLAHIYLSFDDRPVMIGNFIADSIRGNRYGHLPGEIQRGIVLHRAIDTFTDAHPIPRLSSKRLHSRYSHYSRVIVDIYYDHFLAKNWERYSDIPLESFVEHFYNLLREHDHLLPPAVKRMMPYMISENWLVNYARPEGIRKVLAGMDRRTHYRSGMKSALEELQEFYPSFEEEFATFFSDLRTFAYNEYQKLCDNS